MFTFRSKVNASRTRATVRSPAGERPEDTEKTSAKDAAFPFDGEEESVPIAAAGLPPVFRDPGEFRRVLEQRSEPPPRVSVPAPPVYLLLVCAMVSWCYYGYRYNQTHFPVPLKELVVFFAVLLVPFIFTLFFRDLDRRVKLHPLLSRTAALRPGAFVVTEHKRPRLFYARESWLGMVCFEEGGEDRDAFTRLEARMREPRGRLSIRKRGVLDKVFSGSVKHLVTVAGNDFGRKYLIWSPDENFARKFLDARVEGAIFRLSAIGQPRVDFDGTFVRVSVGTDTSKWRRATALARFLAEAETIVGAAAREGPVARPASGLFAGAVS
jgi:hypothetical protein